MTKQYTLFAVFFAACACAANAGDMHCGPRAVAEILEHFGIEADLLSLVLEVDRPDLESPSSLRSVEAVLNKRGLACKAVYCFGGAPDFNLPYIVHGVTSNNETHFEAIIPGRSSQLQSLVPSGYYLLVSRSKVELSELASKPQRMRQAFKTFFAICASFFFVLLLLRIQRLFKCRSATCVFLSSILLCLVFSSKTTARTTEARDNPDGNDQNAAEFVLLGVLAGRETPSSGAFEATHAIERDGEPWRTSEVFCAFDWSANRFRFDRRFTVNHDDVVAYDGAIIAMEDRKVHRYDAGNSNTIDIVPINRNIDYVSDPFYFNNFGLNTGRTIYKREDFREAIALFSKPMQYAPVSTSKAGDFWELKWANSRFNRVLRIDSSKNYWPIELEFQISDKPPAKACVVVESVYGYWLPVSFYSESGNGAETTTERIELRWLSAGSVDERAFDWLDLRRDETERVVDRQLGTSVVIERFVHNKKASSGFFAQKRTVLAFLAAMLLAAVAILLKRSHAGNVS
jgi:hypothetical protein